MPTATSSPSTWERVKGFLKTHKVISRGLAHLAKMDRLKKYSGRISTASNVASSLGYGRRKRRAPVRRRRVARR